jgi:hypothetical protein
MRYIRQNAAVVPAGSPSNRLEKLNIVHPEDLCDLRDVIANLASGVQRPCCAVPARPLLTLLEDYPGDNCQLPRATRSDRQRAYLQLEAQKEVAHG